MTSSSSARAAGSVKTWATIAEVLAAIVALGGLLGGFSIAFTQSSSSGFYEDEYPYLWLGVAVAFGAVFQAVLVVAVAEYLKMRAAVVLDALQPAPSPAEAPAVWPGPPVQPTAPPPYQPPAATY